MELGYSVRRWCGPRRLLVIVTALALLTSFATQASAQLTPVAVTQTAASFIVRGIAAAHDPVNDRYLVLGAQDHVTGVLVNASGAPVSSTFVIKPKSTANNVPYGSFPRAAYSPHINGGQGGFLVVWAMEKSNTTQLHMRIVTSAGAVLGSSDTVVSDSNAWKDIAGAAVAYSPQSQVFLIAWKVSPVSAAKVRVQRVGINGALVGPSVIVSAGFGRDPGVTWNPNRNEFGVSYAGEDGTKRFVAFVRVPASNPAGFLRTTFNVLSGGTTAVTDISFNPETDRYVVSWWEANGGVKAKIAEINEDGTVVALGVASFKIGSYDALSSAYNAFSKTILLSGLDVTNDDVIGAELNGRGFRISTEQNFIATPADFPARYTRVEASATGPRWINLISRKFGAIWNRVIQTSTTGGGAAGNHPAPGSGGSTGGGGGGTPPPPPPPPQKALVIVDTLTNQIAVSSSFTVAGWAIDPAVQNSVTGIDAVHIYAYPNCVGCGAAVFLGAAIYGVSRPDVGAVYGARFTASGFSRGATLAPGVYDLVVFARKTSNLAWISKVVRVTVH